MDIKPYDKTVKELLISGKQFLIPRFQREYSWEKKNIQEFFDDIINGIKITKNGLVNTPYFLGTMLFVGNYDETSPKEILVVDGQQRLTTITIFFSAISDAFLNSGHETLSNEIFKYIMTTDDDGEEVRVLKSKTHYPFFSHYIQEKNKTNKQRANSEEEALIEESYLLIAKSLSEKNLKTMLSNKHGKEYVNDLNYIDILKTLRDQILNTTFVSISTTDKNQANMIFEILNAKGKKLAYVDLIKNKIFEILDKTEPADYAEDTWEEIKKILYNGNIDVGFATFFRHFWIANFKKSSANRMYDDFLNIVKPKNVAKFTSFINKLKKDAETYVKIVKPERKDYQNRKEYYWLVQSMKALNDSFNIMQVRIVLLAIFDLKEKKAIDNKLFKEVVIFLENFHFAYNAVMSEPTNRLETLYSRFAIDSRKLTKISEVKPRILKLKKDLRALLPTKEAFTENFINLSYSKKENPSNVKAKYAVNKLHCFYEDREIFDDEGSVEHIVSESEGNVTCNIGNLILLEISLNGEADNSKYSEKRALYETSKYEVVKEFVKNYDNFDKTNIEDRARNLANTYYDEILKFDSFPTPIISTPQISTL